MLQSEIMITWNSWEFIIILHHFHFWKLRTEDALVISGALYFAFLSRFTSLLVSFHGSQYHFALRGYTHKKKFLPKGNCAQADYVCAGVKCENNGAMCYDRKRAQMAKNRVSKKKSKTSSGFVVECINLKAIAVPFAFGYTMKTNHRLYTNEQPFVVVVVGLHKILFTMFSNPSKLEDITFGQTFHIVNRKRKTHVVLK